MKINQLFIVLCLSLVLGSCENGKEKVAGPTTDSTGGSHGSGPVSFAKFKNINSLPFVADTALMFRLDTYDSLGTSEVRQLDKNWAVNDSSLGEEYIMREFYMIDSVKASGNYAAWCDSLQPGMTKSSRACAIGRMAIDGGYQLLVWGLSSSSYEACPVTTIQEVYVSIVNPDSVLKTFKLGEYILSVDPPVSMERIITGTINKDLTVDMNLREENDEDMDLPELSVTKGYYRFSIKDGKISMLSQKKEAPVKVKREKK